jgi:hypothetical protein
MRRRTVPRLALRDGLLHPGGWRGLQNLNVPGSTPGRSAAQKRARPLVIASKEIRQCLVLD